MYYLIKGVIRDSENSEEIENKFEWAVRSEEEKEKALADLYDNEEVTEIIEITLDDCIAHEEKIMRSYVRKDYLIRRCADLDEDDYLEAEYQLNEPSELYLTALREYNRREVLMKRLMRRKNFKNIKMGDYFKALNELVAAETDEEINRILRSIDKK